MSTQLGGQPRRAMTCRTKKRLTWFTAFKIETFLPLCSLISFYSEIEAHLFLALVFKWLFSFSVPSYFFFSSSCGLVQRRMSPTHWSSVYIKFLGRTERMEKIFRLEASIGSFLSAWLECVQSVEFKQDGLYQDFISSQGFCWRQIPCHVTSLIVQTVIGQIYVKLTDSSSFSI